MLPTLIRTTPNFPVKAHTANDIGVAHFDKEAGLRARRFEREQKCFVPCMPPRNSG